MEPKETAPAQTMDCQDIRDAFFEVMRYRLSYTKALREFDALIKRAESEGLEWDM